MVLGSLRVPHFSSSSGASTLTSMDALWIRPKRGKAHAKAVAQGRLVETVNDLSTPEFMSKYGPGPGDGRLRDSSLKHGYKYTDGTNISIEEIEGCLNLIEQTSAEDYANSEMGWSRAQKRKEMVLPDMKYIILPRQQQQQEQQQQQLGSIEGEAMTMVDGFISFMITYEDGEEVIYIYEVHLQPSNQGKGYGRSLMDYVETIGRKVGVKKAMLTVFRSNQKAASVYQRLGYEEDEFSPKPRRLRNGTVKEPSYVILSKLLQQ